MDKQRTREIQRQWREQQRAKARGEFPLPFDDLKAMFDMLDADLPRQGCNKTRRLTQQWLESNGHDTEAVFAWLDAQGGYCDCEILANVEEQIDEAMHGL
jgi:hypothetical protein